MIIECWNCGKDFDIVAAIVKHYRDGAKDAVTCPHCEAVHAGSDIPITAEIKAEKEYRLGKGK